MTPNKELKNKNVLIDDFTSTNLCVTHNLHLYSYKGVESNSESHQEGV